MKFLRCLFAAFLFCAANTMAQTNTLYVAAAADLATCIEELNRAFIKSHPGLEIKSSLGASGTFFAQIRHGAPFDVLLSADLAYPQELIKSGDADATSLTIYALGQLVLWSTDTSVDVSKGLGILNAASVQKIALANPDVAPYGRAAKAVLENAKLLDVLKPKLVMGESVAQTAQFVRTGSVQAGFVSLATAAKDGTGNFYRIPQSLYPPLEQGGVVTTKGKSNVYARQYVDFLTSAAGRHILQQHGFVLPK